ncbi:DinB family protein [Jidongwangia harbinensis]|uniref:DinB family protein n=1 Tax=Jidongwangia harbinensis TaxID=2878561 RepID=UPI001CD9434F|nr:DinB family protein [Jidongwangia harbinensis]MCA2215780.1 DinB family protein [Jidongwangia harbinensis]
MPGQVRPVADERDGLVAFLAQMRYQLKLTGYGLSPEQLRATPSASPLSVGGLIWHAAHTEAHWIDQVLQRPTTYPGTYEWDQHFDIAEGASYEDLIGFYDTVAAETERVVAGVADLGQAVPIDHSVPWNPQDYDNWSVRWVLLHLIQETARHAGHADIIRETVDGGTAFPLMAAAEGWPETGWLKPWQPAQ